jgi:hypothetical protein
MRTAKSNSRGFNLMLTAFALLTGLGFATIGYWENGLPAKLDDLALLALGTVLMIWYLIRNNRFQSSLVPVIVILLTVPVQVWGLLIEINDRGAVRNDIVGLYIYVPAAFFAVYWYLRRLSRLRASRPNA